MRQARSGSRAFTLVELLAVVAILALLLSLLVPVFQKARELARRSVCHNNFRVLGEAVLGFAANHDGRGPGCAGKWYSWGYSGPSWAEILNTEHFRETRVTTFYIFDDPSNNRGLLTCPSMVRWYAGETWTYWSVYNYDAHGGEHGRPIPSDVDTAFYGKITPVPPEYASYGPTLDYHLGTRLHQFQRPSWQMMFTEGECGWDVVRPSHAVEVFPVGQDPTHAPYCSAGGGHHAFRHMGTSTKNYTDGTSTMTFIDGHVEALAPEDQLTDVRRYAFH
jgi:prepilin-type N-terminal cleavage/methylation domain-containing protein